MLASRPRKEHCAGLGVNNASDALRPEEVDGLTDDVRTHIGRHVRALVAHVVAPGNVDDPQAPTIGEHDIRDLAVPRVKDAQEDVIKRWRLF